MVGRPLRGRHNGRRRPRRLDGARNQERQSGSTSASQIAPKDHRVRTLSNNHASIPPNVLTQDISVPTFFVATEEGQTDILEQLPQPYDPTDNTVSAKSTYNWDTEPPQPPSARVVAAPDDFEETRDPAETSKFTIPPGSGHPDSVVRLKAEVAGRQRLESKWTVIVRKYDGKDSPPGSIVLQQDWDTSGGLQRVEGVDVAGIETA